jgi:hypothetical protein
MGRFERNAKKGSWIPIPLPQAPQTDRWIRHYRRRPTLSTPVMAPRPSHRWEA